MSISNIASSPMPIAAFGGGQNLSGPGANGNPALPNNLNPASTDGARSASPAWIQAVADKNGAAGPYYWTPHLLPGQQGYIPQPLSSRFDKDGKLVKRGTLLDTQA